jgi:hypothetical protein
MPGIAFGGAMAGRASTVTVSLSEASREQFLGKLKLAHDLMFASAQARRFGTFRIDLHLHVAVHAELGKSNTDLGIRK